MSKSCLHLIEGCVVCYSLSSQLVDSISLLKLVNICSPDGLEFACAFMLS
jgi:hypothetical protein